MKTLRQVTFYTALLLLLAATVQAEGRHPRGPQDLDGDGQISRSEFDQWADDVFDKLDTDDNQVIAEDEMVRPGGRRGGHRGAPAGLAGRGFVHAADDNGDGAVENGEWQVFLAGLEVDAEGGLTEDSLQSLLPPRPRHPGVAEGENQVEAGDTASGDRRVRFAGRLFDTDHDGAVTIAELNALFITLDANDDGTLAADEIPSFGPGGRRGGRDRGGRADRGRFSS